VEGSPVADGGHPVDVETGPVVDGGPPVDVETSPVVDGGPPAVDGGASIVDGGHPVVLESSPVVDGGRPVVVEGSPVVDGGTVRVDRGPLHIDGGRAIADRMTAALDRTTPAPARPRYLLRRTHGTSLRMGQDATFAREAYAALLAEQDWGEVSVALVSFLEDREVAEELHDDFIAEAFLRIFDHRRSPWDSASGMPLVEHALSVCSSVLSNTFKKETARQTSPMGDDLPDNPPDSDRNAEVSLLKAERAARAKKAVMTRLADRPLALRIVELEERFITEPDAQAAALGVDVQQVYRARKTIWEVVRDLGRDSSDSDIRAVFGGARARGDTKEQA
jgi:hypothetical protein